MKRHSKIILGAIFSGTLLLTACSEKDTKKEQQDALEKKAENLEEGKSSSALEYNDGLVGIQGRVAKKMMEVYKTDEPSELMVIFDNAIAECQDAQQVLKNLKAYDGGNKLKSLLLDWTVECEVLMEKMKKLNSHDENVEYTDDELQVFIDLENSLADDAPLIVKITKLEDDFIAEQYVFGSKYGLTIGDNPYEEEFEELERQAEERETAE